MREMHMKFMMMLILAGFLLAVIPVSAVKTAEQSVSGSLTRGSRFTVTITGIPNSSYYVWLPNTFTMTGEPRDQPPFIPDNQYNVMEDPEGGPYAIGSYRYNNGNGLTIRDDVASSTPDMPNTLYYALVTTDTSGQATVEFQTSVNTGLRSYSVKVENPRSIDSDTLMIELHVYSRRAPAPIEISTTLQPVITTVMPTTVVIPPPVTTPPVTTPPAPVQTSLPAETPSQKAPIAIGTGILATALSLILIRRH